MPNSDRGSPKNTFGEKLREGIDTLMAMDSVFQFSFSVQPNVMGFFGLTISLLARGLTVNYALAIRGSSKAHWGCSEAYWDDIEATAGRQRGYIETTLKKVTL